MAIIKLNSYAIHDVHEYNGVKAVVISLHIGGDNPFPSENVEVRSVAEVKAALEAYAVRAKATGKPIQVSAYCPRGQRKPNGFDKADLTINVNI